MTSIRDAITEMDEEADDWEEINGEDGSHSVKEYENHEDSILAFAETAETWIRAALRVLHSDVIDQVDAAVWPPCQHNDTRPAGIDTDGGHIYQCLVCGDTWNAGTE